MSKVKMPEPKAPEVAQRLHQAKNDLAELRAQQEQIALAAMRDESGAQGRYDELASQLAKTERFVSMLTAAHTAVVREDQVALAAAQAAAHKTQVNIVRQAFSAFSKSADRFEKSLRVCEAERQTMLREGDRARNAIAALGHDIMLADAAYVLPDAIARLIQVELYRQTASAQEGRTDWPTPNARDINYVFQPFALPSMTEQIKQAHDETLAKIEGRPLPPPVQRQTPPPPPWAKPIATAPVAPSVSEPARATLAQQESALPGNKAVVNISYTGNVPEGFRPVRTKPSDTTPPSSDI